MSTYTVKELSELAGVSIRTLHHYDQIGLLKPESRRESGYRYYGRSELLRLQQILFYRELDFPLEEIRLILDSPEFDVIQSLMFHRTELQTRANRLNILLKTIDKTISDIQIRNDMITDKEMYEGFSEEQVKAYREEASERWGEDKVMESEEKVRKMSKEDFAKVKQKGKEIEQRLRSLMGKDPSSAEVQNAIAEHYEYINTFYTVTEEIYRGLGKMYTEDDRFYDKDLSVFINAGIVVFCDKMRS